VEGLLRPRGEEAADRVQDRVRLADDSRRPQAHEEVNRSGKQSGWPSNRVEKEPNNRFGLRVSALPGCAWPARGNLDVPRGAPTRPEAAPLSGLAPRVHRSSSEVHRRTT